MKLSVYLVARGSKMLTQHEAVAFGIPHPLEHRWATKYAGLELTMVKLQALFHAIQGDRSPPANNARRGLLAAATQCLGGAPLPPPAPRVHRRHLVAAGRA